TVGRAVRELIGEGFQRDSICVVTKGGYVPRALRSCGLLSRTELKLGHSISAQYLALSLEQSLQNLGLEHIDVFLLHNPEVCISLWGRKRIYEVLIETFAFLAQRRRREQIGAYGLATWNGLRVPCSHPYHIDLEHVLRCARVAAGGISGLRVIE